MSNRVGRASHELRPVVMHRAYTEMTPGSVLIEMGRTRVLCTVSLDRDVPPWMRDSGEGWITAEYAMLPGSSQERIRRSSISGGRVKEIQRLIGRSLRAAVDLGAMPGVTARIDCDVLQADGGTRTAAICGGYVALHDALTRLLQQGAITAHPLTAFCAAVSVGVVGGVPVLDLPYDEDSTADVDMNLVMTSEGRYVEVQGTAEGQAFTRGELDAMLGLGEKGIAEILDLQRAVVAEPPAFRPVSSTA